MAAVKRTGGKKNIKGRARSGKLQRGRVLAADGPIPVAFINVRGGKENHKIRGVGKYLFTLLKSIHGPKNSRGPRGGKKGVRALDT